MGKGLTFYCRLCVDFEGLDIGKWHDHMENVHPEVLKDKTELERFYKQNIVVIDGRHSDRVMVTRTWGRPPKLGTEVADNERAK